MLCRGLTISGAILVAAPTTATAAVNNFVLVNGTKSAMESVAIRRFRSGSWQPLAGIPRPGGRVEIPLKDEDCAFDIRATFAGEVRVVWSGVNLCEARAVILREEGGLVWVDYD